MPLNVDKIETGSLSINGTEVIPSAPQPYKVYTALLTQSGGNEINLVNSGPLVKGVTYSFGVSAVFAWDFSNVGGPVFPEAFSFVATDNAEPNNWGSAKLQYNTGAPVVTVLENTIGNIWFLFGNTGQYRIYSNDINWNNGEGIYFTIGGTNGTTSDYSPLFVDYSIESNYVNFSSKFLDSGNLNVSNGMLKNTPIEIRVYN